jgi:hypothetical protein
VPTAATSAPGLGSRLPYECPGAGRRRASRRACCCFAHARAECAWRVRSGRSMRARALMQLNKFSLVPTLTHLTLSDNKICELTILRSYAIFRCTCPSNYSAVLGALARPSRPISPTPPLVPRPGPPVARRSGPDAVGSAAQ